MTVVSNEDFVHPVLTTFLFLENKKVGGSAPQADMLMNAFIAGRPEGMGAVPVPTVREHEEATFRCYSPHSEGVGASVFYLRLE